MLTICQFMHVKKIPKNKPSIIFLLQLDKLTDFSNIYHKLKSNVTSFADLVKKQWIIGEKTKENICAIHKW